MLYLNTTIRAPVLGNLTSWVHSNHNVPFIAIASNTYKAFAYFVSWPAEMKWDTDRKNR